MRHETLKEEKKLKFVKIKVKIYFFIFKQTQFRLHENLNMVKMYTCIVWSSPKKNKIQTNKQFKQAPNGGSGVNYRKPSDFQFSRERLQEAPCLFSLTCSVVTLEDKPTSPHFMLKVNFHRLP